MLTNRGAPRYLFLIVSPQSHYATLEVVVHSTRVYERLCVSLLVFFFTFHLPPSYSTLGEEAMA